MSDPTSSNPDSWLYEAPTENDPGPDETVKSEGASDPHRKETHRILSVEYAVKAGADPNNVVKLAKEINGYLSGEPEESGPSLKKRLEIQLHRNAVLESRAATNSNIISTLKAQMDANHDRLDVLQTQLTAERQEVQRLTSELDNRSVDYNHMEVLREENARLELQNEHQANVIRKYHEATGVIFTE